MKSEDDILFLFPDNFSARFEIFPGIGWKEMGIIALSLALSFLIFLSLGKIKKTIYIDPEEISFESTIGVTEEYTLNEEGMIEEKTNAVPGIIRFILLIFPPATVTALYYAEPSTKLSLMALLRHLKKFARSQKNYRYVHNSGSLGRYEDV